ncbi:MAG: hypothetical protein JO334_10025 [Verrucomicrobia bacterium]|nr:hypothetical protein [Verrucomicrobiota bacterium]
MKTSILTLSPSAARDGRTDRRRGGTCLPSSKSKRNRYYAIRTIFASVIGCFLVASSSLSEPLPYRIAEELRIRGKGEDGECMDYAIAVSSKLAANGIHGQLIFYRWHIRNTTISGSHVFVVYRLPDGSEWIVDNEIPEPKKVPPEASPMQLVLLLSGDPSAPVDVELQNGLNQLSFF